MDKQTKEDIKVVLEWLDIIDSMPAGSTPATEACRRIIAELKRLKKACGC